MLVSRQSHRASLRQAKRDLKKEKIQSPSDAWKAYLKPGISKIAKAFRGKAPYEP